MRNYFKRSFAWQVFFLLAALFLTGLPTQAAMACSRVLSADNGQAVLVGRNMDWPEKTDVAFWFLPKGLDRTGLNETASFDWQSQYSSIVLASSVKGKAFVSDGVNEAGLEANLLWLDESNYGTRDPKRKGISIALWAQYVLDNYATVAEAVADIRAEKYQIVDVNVPMYIATIGTQMTRASLHLALADKTGDSAVIEYIDGKPVIYHNRAYNIMTNSPTFDKQQANLKQYKGFGGTLPLPGTSTPTDRFVRAAYYLKNLPQPHSAREALAHILSVTRNASQPFITSVDPKNPYTAATVWRTVGDLTHGIYYFESTTSPYLVWAAFNDFSSDRSHETWKLDLSRDPDYNGDVSALFVRADATELNVPDFTR